MRHTHTQVAIKNTCSIFEPVKDYAISKVERFLQTQVPSWTDKFI